MLQLTIRLTQSDVELLAKEKLMQSINLDITESSVELIVLDKPQQVINLNLHNHEVAQSNKIALIKLIRSAQQDHTGSVKNTRCMGLEEAKKYIEKYFNID